MLTLVLRLVVERKGLCATLNTQDCAGVTRIGLVTLDAADGVLVGIHTT
jgi:hypothetical protein